MTDILLVQPPVEDFYLTRKRTLPYGLAAIAGSLRTHGYKVDIFDALATDKTKIISWPESFEYLRPYYGRADLSVFSLFHEFRHFGYSFEHIGKTAKEKQPFLVGISSLFTAYSDTAFQAAKAVRNALPRCKIVLGGHHVTLLPESAMACREIDYVLRGEGEQSMPLLADAIKGLGRLDQVPGIVFRKADDSLHMSEPSWIKNLDDAPLPALDLVNQRFYQRRGKGAAMVVSSRGCPMTCTYCAVSAASSYAPFRKRGIDHIIKELKSQVDLYDTVFIDFEDENLCLKKSWFLSLMEQIGSEFPQRNFELRAMNGLFPPSIDPDIVKAMAKAGFKTLNLSLGSTSKKQLERFSRKDVRKSFEQALALAREYHLESVSYIIAAAPGQDPFESVDDLVYLASKPTLAGLSVFYPAPGSVDYRRCAANGLLPKNFSLMRSTALPVCHTTQRIQSVTLLRLTRILNFMKSLKNNAIRLPASEICRQETINPDMDKQASGILLLSWFLYDGNIRGIDKDGTLYHHAIDPALTRQFIKKISPLAIQGTF